MKKRVISMALVLLMMLTLLPAAAFAAGAQVITEVEVEGYMDPILGEENNGYIYPSISGDAPYNLVCWQWYSDSEQSSALKPMNSGVKFDVLRQYKFYMEFSPKDGYTFSKSAYPNRVINEGTVSPGSGYGITSEGNYYFWGPMVEAKGSCSFNLYRDSADEYATVGFDVPEGYILRTPGKPGEEGRTFIGWYYDRECTDPFIPNRPVYEDVSLYGKWVAEDADIIVSEVKVYLSYFPPTVGEEAVSCNYAYVFPSENYTVTDSCWFCDSRGEEYGENELFQLTDECSFGIKIEPKEGYAFDSTTKIVLVDCYGETVAVDWTYSSVDTDEIKIWTKIVNPIERVIFYNGWGEAGDYVPKGFIPGEIAEPGREGYIFAGWFTDPECTVPFDPTQPLLVDTTIYAKWIAEGSANPFVDVQQGTPYYDAILWAYYHTPNQITSGYTATEFCPQNPCTRAQVVTFLWRAAGCPEPTGDVSIFKDADDIASPFLKAVAWAVEKGITTGFNDGTFRPNDSVTRAQFVTFLYRFEGKPATSGSIDVFPDAAEIAAPYQQAVAWAVEKGITSGYYDGTFRPDDVCTRWAVVLFMYRDMK